MKAGENFFNLKNCRETPLNLKKVIKIHNIEKTAAEYVKFKEIKKKFLKIEKKMENFIKYEKIERKFIKIEKVTGNLIKFEKMRKKIV